MDRVTQGFLDEFSSEHELGNMPPDRKFEHFASFVTVRRHYNGESFATDEIHMGGGGDTGIDALAILVNGSIVTDVDSLQEHIDLSGHFDVTFVFVQAERTSGFDGKKISDFGFGVKDFFAPQPKLRRNDAIKYAAEVMDALYKSGTKFRPGNPICRMYYVTTGTWQSDHDLEARHAAVEADLRSLQIFREVSFNCIGAEPLQQFYRQTKNAVTAQFTFANRILLPEISGVPEAYIGFIPLGEFMEMVTDTEGELLNSIFYENVRDWQEYTANVNEEIRQTALSNHTDRFVIMNNGITMIAKTLTPLRGHRFQIEDFQIVNGCQTTHVLFDCFKQADENLLIPIRIISTDDHEVIKSIIRGTNRQTKVEDDQFFALTDFAEHLEEYFQTFPDVHRLYYERRSGQYSRQNIHATRVVPHRTLVRAVGAMFLNAPHQTTRSYKVLRDSIGKEMFAKGQRLEPYYLAAYALYKLDVNFRTQRLDPSLKLARFHILLAMRLLVNSNQLPRMNAHEMQRYCDAIQKILWNNNNADDLCADAAEIVKKSAGGTLDRDDVHTQPFTERVVARCARRA